MVHVTSSYLIHKMKSKRQLQRRRKNETDDEYLNRMTHLYLQSQYVEKMDAVAQCNSVLVVYLQNNLLKNIHNMGNFPNLTHLYLQKNQIRKIENLEPVENLRKIYLGYNEICVLEGLGHLRFLTEIHVEGQRLPSGEKLHCDPRTLQSLASSVKVLNVSGNKLTRLGNLRFLSDLRSLIAANNDVDDLDDVTSTVSALRELTELDLSGNPVTDARKYRDSLIFASRSLSKLDERDIQGNTRDFITNLVVSRANSRASCHKFKPDSASFSRPEMDVNLNPSIGSRLFPAWKHHKDRNQVLLQRSTSEKLQLLSDSALQVKPSY